MTVARSRSYDDYSDNNVSRRGSSSSRVLLVVILLSIVICAVAVLCWVKILETQDVANQKVTVLNPVSDNAADKVQQENKVEFLVETPAANSVSSVMASTETRNMNVSLNIDDALSRETDSENSVSNFNFISSADYSLANDDAGSVVSEQGIEMKKPLIAQNLSISQQSSFSKDLVKYQEYSIQDGDSLVSIAESFGLEMTTIISVNQITSPSSLFIGSTLQIPDRDGTLYTVRENDTLLSITQQYSLSISAKTLGDINGVRDDSLKVGQKIFIPSETETSGTITNVVVQSFIKPADGVISAMYNQKVVNPLTDEVMKLDGIHIQGSQGDPVYASEAGTVIDKGFNENGSASVMIMHNNGYRTVYDYIADVCVETTDKVEKGQVIGYFGDDTSNNPIPIIFFKIEQDGMALDPYSFF